jgi:Pyruvate/2-oxoacid:ferredoxin oxidoreductase delta subunit
MPQAELPDIDPRLCTACADCIAACPTQCLALSKWQQVVLAAHECISCRICELVCTPKAIAMRMEDW